LCAVVLTLAVGCADKPKDIQADAQARWDDYRAAVKYELASEELKSGNVDRAIALAREVGGLSPDKPAHIELLAKGYLSRGDFSAARKALEAGSRAFPDQGVLHYLLGTIYERDGDWPRAVEAYSAAARAAPDDLDALVAACQAESRIAPERAMQRLARAAETSRYEPRYHLAAAELHQQQGRPLQAAQAYKRAIDLGASDPSLRSSAGMCFYQAGHFAEARELLAPGAARQVEDLNATHAVAYARCLIETGSREQARQLLEQFTSTRDASPAAWLLLAEARAMDGSRDEAAAAAMRAVALDPRSGPAHMLLAALQLAAGSAEVAVASACRAVDCDPYNPEAYLLLGRIYERRDDAATAARMYRTAVELDPTLDMAAVLLARLEAGSAH
jgi:Flp pilus assembly protein TadD